MFYNARFYDSQLGRFTSADSIIPESQGAQAYDRYAYVNNNPLRYTDPTGHLSVIPLIMTVVAVVAIVAAVEVTIYSVNNTPQGEQLRNQAVEGIMRMAKDGLPANKYRQAQSNLNQMNYSADDLNGNGPQLRGCGKDPATCIFVGVSFVITSGVILYNKYRCSAEEGDSCGNSKSPNLIVPSVTPTQTLALPSIYNLEGNPFGLTVEPTLQAQLNLLTPSPTPTRRLLPVYTPQKPRQYGGSVE